MISFSITSDLEGAITRVEDWSFKLHDLRPLADRVQAILESQNAASRSLGEDRYGVAFTDLAPSTMKKRIRQGRLGPPLAPDGSASPIIAGFVTEQTVFSSDDILITGSWPTAPWVRYHMTGNSNLPQRDPVGIPAFAQDAIAEAFDEFVSGLIANTY